MALSSLSNIWIEQKQMTVLVENTRPLFITFFCFQSLFNPLNMNIWCFKIESGRLTVSKGKKVKKNNTKRKRIFFNFHGWLVDNNEVISSNSDALIGLSCWLHKVSSQLQNVTDAPFMLFEVHWLIAWSLLHWRLTTEMEIDLVSIQFWMKAKPKHDVKLSLPVTLWKVPRDLRQLFVLSGHVSMKEVLLESNSSHLYRDFEPQTKHSNGVFTAN